MLLNLRTLLMRGSAVLFALTAFFFWARPRGQALFVNPPIARAGSTGDLTCGMSGGAGPTLYPGFCLALVVFLGAGLLGALWLSLGKDTFLDADRSNDKLTVRPASARRR